MMSTGLAKKINILCLLTAIIAVLFLPVKKKIWYDESVSILCSKGITYDSHQAFDKETTVTSASIEQLNTMANVYKATVADNSNSFLYNACLHCFTMMCGNSITAYMLLSRLCAIATLLALYWLCSLLMKDSVFTGVALVLLALDINFMGMSHEIRAYAMGTFFITLAAVNFYKSLYQSDRPVYLFLSGLFSAAAILCHFLSLYVVLVFLCYLLFTKKAKLFSAKNIAALVVPVLTLAVYFYCSLVGLSQMSAQNTAIQHKTNIVPFSILQVLLHSVALGGLDFKAVYSAFGEKIPAILCSILLIAGLYIAAIKATGDAVKKRNTHLLFILGASGSVFLAMLCFKSHHYTALYGRYHSFCAPFATLFTCYAMYVLFGITRINKLIKGGILAAIVVPVCLLFFLFYRKSTSVVKYNHIEVAAEIEQRYVTKIEVPSWDDAFLIQAVLPKGYKINYVLNKSSPYFTLYTPNEEKVLVIRDNS